MIYSNERKLCLSGWLKNRSQLAYCSPLRLQKFLFLYEAFAKNENDYADFDSLKGWKRGPVFSNVWGDYTKDRLEFNKEADIAYSNDKDYVNQERAERCHFIVSSLSEHELSSLTHEFHIWNAKESRIISGERQVPLDESDFTDNDHSLISSLRTMFPLSLIMNSTIIPVGGKKFVFSYHDAKKLSEEHYDALYMLSENEELHNPVYVYIDTEGRMNID